MQTLETVMNSMETVEKDVSEENDSGHATDTDNEMELHQANKVIENPDDESYTKELGKFP